MPPRGFAPNVKYQIHYMLHNLCFVIAKLLERLRSIQTLLHRTSQHMLFLGEMTESFGEEKLQRI